jgi:hypothetical protein
MAKTYEPIATTTLGSAQSSVTFSGISSSYTDLILVYDGNNSDSNAGMRLRINSDSDNNYSDIQLNGYSSGMNNSRSTNANAVDISFGSTEKTNSIANFMNYSNTSMYKTILVRTGLAGGNGAIRSSVMLWRNSSAINNILVFREGGQTISSGSTFTIYGILEA